jgi:hypothetical protein
VSAGDEVPYFEAFRGVVEGKETFRPVSNWHWSRGWQLQIHIACRLVFRVEESVLEGLGLLFASKTPRDFASGWMGWLQ